MRIFTQNLLICFLFLSLLSFYLSNAQLAVPVTCGNVNYFQPFNSLGGIAPGAWVNGTTIPGWHVNDASTNYKGFSNGSSPVAGVYAFGTGIEQALGAIGSNIPGDPFRFGFLARNNTGRAIRAITVTYWLEQWRTGNSDPLLDGILLSYKQAPSIVDVGADNGPGWISHPILDGLPVQAGANTCIGGTQISGNSVANRKQIRGVIVFASPVPDGDYIAIRWENFFNTCPGYGLSIDDFTARFHTIEPPSLFHAAGVGCTQFRLNWVDPPNFQDLELSVATDSNFIFTVTGYPKIIGPGVQTDSIGGLTPNTQYYARINSRDATCGGSESKHIPVMTQQPLSIGSITASNSLLCSFGSTVDFTLSSFNGNIVWEQDLGCTNTFVVAPNSVNSPNYTSVPLSGHACFRAKVVGIGCAPQYSNVVQVDVYPGPAGPLSLLVSTDPVCQGQSAIYRVAPQPGVVDYHWGGFPATASIVSGQSTTDFTLDWGTTPGGLVNMTVAATNPCGTGPSLSVPVNVRELPQGGFATPATSLICPNDLAPTINVGAFVGIVNTWQKDVNCTNSWINIPGTSGMTSFAPGNLAQTTCFRAVVANPPCPTPVISTAARVEVRPQVVGGQITPNIINACSPANGTLNLNGFAGNIIRWEASNDNFTSFTMIPGSSPIQTYTGVTTNRQYRVVVTDGVCNTVYSDTATINVSPAAVGGAITSTETEVCRTGNSFTLTLGGYSGSVQGWERLIAGSVVEMIPNQTETLVYNNLTATSTFRARVGGPNCPVVPSSDIVITVSNPPNPGVLTGAANVCAGANSGNLQLIGNTGNVSHWEAASASLGVGFVIPVAGPVLTYSNLTEATSYKVFVQTPGCAPVASNSVTVNVSPPPVGGTTLSPNNQVCFNGSTSVQVVGQTGVIEKWQFSTNCTGTWTDLPFVTPAIATGVLSATTCYRAVLMSGSCSRVYSTVMQIDVLNPLVAGHTVSDVTCSGTNDGSITVTGNSPNLEYSNNGGVSWQVGNVFTNLTQGSYQLRVRSSLNASCQSPIIGANVNKQLPAFGIASIIPSNTSCNVGNDGSIALTLSAGGSPPFTFAWSNGMASQNISGLAAGTYTVTVSDGTGCQRMASTVVQAAVPNYSYVVNRMQPTCAGIDNGGISVAVTGGTPPYSFTWSNGAPNANAISNLAAGSYAVTISDATGCQSVENITLNPGSQIAVSVSANQVRCPADPSGFVNATPAGGQPPFSFLWSNGATTSNVSGVTAGTYSVTVTDNAGCIATSQASVTAQLPAPAEPTVTANTSSICLGDAVTFTAETRPNVSNFWYSAPTGGFMIAFGDVFQARPTNVGVATYYVEAYDVNNPICRSLRVPATVQVSNPSFGGRLSPVTQTACEGDPILMMTLGNRNGAVVRWEASTDGFATVQPIQNVTDTFTPQFLSFSTVFRAVVQNQGCAEAYSEPAHVNIIPVGSCGAAIYTSTSSLPSFGVINQGCGSHVQSYTLSAAGLSTTLVATAPNGFELSLSANGPFSNRLLFQPNNGVVPNTEIYVRAGNTILAGVYNLSISHTSANSAPVHVDVSVTVTFGVSAVITASTTSVDFGSVAVNSTSTPQSFTVRGDNITAGFLTLVAQPPFSISRAATGPYGTTVNIMGLNCAVAETEVFVRFAPTEARAYTGNAVIMSGNTNVSVRLLGTGDVNAPLVPPRLVNANWRNQADVDAALGAGQRIFGVNAFGGLQEAVDAAAPDEVIGLSGGTHFTENVIIDKPVIIEGEGPGVTVVQPQGGARNTYPNATPDDALNPTYEHNHAIIIESDDVVVRNITIDGGASASCEDRFGVGIISNSNTGIPFNNIQIENVEVKHVYSRGIQLYNSGETHLISNSRVEDVCLRLHPDPAVYTQAAGIYVNDPAVISNNVILDAGTGILVEGQAGMQQSRVENNDISRTEASGISIDLRFSPGARNIVVQNNRIDGVGEAGIEAAGLGNQSIIGSEDPALRNVITVNTQPGRAPGAGVEVTHSSGAAVVNNEIFTEGLENGVNLFHNDNFGEWIRVHGNTLTRTGTPAVNPAIGEATGIFLSDNPVFMDGQSGASYAAITSAAIEGYNIGIFTNRTGLNDVEILVGGDGPNLSTTIRNCETGIRVNGASRARVRNNARSIVDCKIGVEVYGADCLIEGNAIYNNQIGVKVYDKPGYTGTARIVSNMIYNNSVANVQNQSTKLGNVVNAEYNWWGASDENTVRSRIDAGTQGVDYSPWLNSDTDTDLDLYNGFQGVQSALNVSAQNQQKDTYGKIQEAVDNPLTQTIIVHSGTYNEAVKVTRNLTFTTPNSSVTPVIAGLSIEGAAGTQVSMLENFDISGALSLTSGKIKVSDNKVLRVLLGGSVTGGNADSYVWGSLARQSNSTSSVKLFYPLGTMFNYRPATMDLMQNSTGLNTYIGTIVEPNGLSLALPTGVTAVSTTRAHRFTASGPASITTATMALNYGSDDLSGRLPNQLTLVKEQAGAWANLSGAAAGNPDGTIASGQNFTTLGAFAVAYTTGGQQGGTVGMPLITNVMNVTTNSAQLFWTNATCPGARYELHYRQTGASEWKTQGNLTMAYYQLSGLQSGTTYDISVRWICGNGQVSEWSNGQFTSFTTLATPGSCDQNPVPAPDGVSVQVNGATSATIVWNLKTTGAPQGYIISVGTFNTPPQSWPQFTVCHPSSAYTMTGLTPGMQYGFRIRTNCSNCYTALNAYDRRSDWTPIRFFRTANSRVDDVDANVSQVSVYPNPSNGAFTVRFTAETVGEARLTLTDLAGRTVLAHGFTAASGENQVPVTVSGYAPGVYVLRFEYNGLTQTERLVIE